MKENIISCLTKKHVPISLISNGIDMRRDFMSLLSSIELYNLLCVDRVESVRVDHNTKQSGVSLEEK